MFDRLVESKNNAGESKRRAGFLITTLFTVVSLFLVTLTYSLFAKDFGMGDESLELSTLVAPVMEVSKPQPETPKPTEKTAAAAPSNVIMRTEAFESVEQSTKPPATTAGQKDVQSWVKGARLGKENLTPSTQNNYSPRNEGSIGDGINLSNNLPEKETEPPPVVTKPTPKPAPIEPKKNIIASGGVVNGKATSLVKPQYSAAAKAVKASGAVNVQVTIDEKGNVISASAVSGHQLLRQAAEQAARASKFTPTFLTGQAVKVTGVIIYNFNVQ